MAVTVQDMQSAIAAAIGGLRSDLTTEFTSVRDSATAAREETRQQFITEKDAVGATVTERLESASKGFRDEQTRVNGLLERIQRELEEMKSEIQTAIQKVETVSDGKLNEVATTLVAQQALMTEFKTNNDVKVDTVLGILKSEVRDMHTDFRDRLGEVRQ